MTDDAIELLRNYLTTDGEPKLFWTGEGRKRILRIGEVPDEPGPVGFLADGEYIALSITDLKDIEFAPVAPPSVKFTMLALRQLIWDEAGLSKEDLRKVIFDAVAGRVESAVRYVVGNTPSLKGEVLRQIPAALTRAVADIVHKEVLDNLHISLHRYPPPKERERAVDLDGGHS